MMINSTTEMRYTNVLKDTKTTKTWKEIDNLNRSIYIKEIKLVVKNLLKQIQIASLAYTINI